MKKILKSIIMLLGLSLLVSCGDDGGEKIDDSFAMKATVLNIDEKIEVDVIESEYAFGVYWIITSDATEYYGKDGKRCKREDIAVGDTVEIRYSGQVMMSYPPQVVAAKIKIL